MIDDLKYIHEKDVQDALGVAGKQWQQLEYSYDFGHIPQNGIKNVVFSGMGGSALAALIGQSWPGYNLPFEIVRGYNLPPYVTENTLVIVSSYSGNTEETLSVLAEAETKDARIVVLTAGGKLAEIARAKKYPCALLPSGLQPRYAALYSLKALVSVLATAGVVAADSTQALTAAAEFVKQATASWRPDVPTAQNQAKQLAQELMGKSAVVYAGSKLFPAAYKWKISLNENAKNVAWCGQYPEFNHNEFLGWTSHPVQKPYAVIELRSQLEHPRIQKRFEVSERLLSGMRPAPLVIHAEGTSLLEQLLWTIALGDFVSIYVALLNGLNPTPVALIEKFKTALNE